MTGVIYPLEGAWTWGGSDVFGMYNLGDDFGFSDFAGSGIVHMAGAAAALAGVLLLGPRKGKYGSNGEVNAIPGANSSSSYFRYFHPMDGLVRLQRWFCS